MTDDWDNEVNLQFTVVAVPSLYVPVSGPKIFLAGSIDHKKGKNWREEISDYIQESWFDSEDNTDHITIYSPRRADDVWKPDMEVEQAAWDMSMLDMSDYIILHLTGDTVSPVSLLELGIYMKSPNLYLSVDSSYTRKHIVELYVANYGKNKICKSLVDSVSIIRNHWINTNTE